MLFISSIKKKKMRNKYLAIFFHLLFTLPCSFISDAQSVKNNAAESKSFHLFYINMYNIENTSYYAKKFYNLLDSCKSRKDSFVVFYADGDNSKLIDDTNEVNNRFIQKIQEYSPEPTTASLSNKLLIQYFKKHLRTNYKNNKIEIIDDTFNIHFFVAPTIIADYQELIQEFLTILCIAPNIGNIDKLRIDLYFEKNTNDYYAYLKELETNLFKSLYRNNIYFNYKQLVKLYNNEN
jgi:hypothetical protein